MIEVSRSKQIDKVKLSLDSDKFNYFLAQSLNKVTSHRSLQQLAKTLADHFIQNQIEIRNKSNQQRQRQNALPQIVRRSQQSIKVLPKPPRIEPRQSQIPLNKVPFTILEPQYSYLLGGGNNHELIKRIMDTRREWHQCKSTTRVHFRWQQSNIGYKYYKMNAYNPHRSLVNHFEFHQEISNKKNLLLNMTAFCESIHRNVFDILPLTFVIDFNDSQIESQLVAFLNYYNQYSPNPVSQEELLLKKQEIKKKLRIPPSKDRKFIDYQMKDTFLGDDYLWLLKPTGLNRGRGINVFNNLDQLTDLLIEYTSGVSEKHIETPNEKIYQGIIIKSPSFVVQKYIEKPLLINNRKFDIRVWVLVDQELNCYFFKEGYIRTASEDFVTNDVNNLFIHLTNNAIQKYSQKYGDQEAGNQLSFDQIQKIFKNKIDFRQTVVKKMKEIAFLAMSSVGTKINRNNRRNCMEIFGFDYFLDEKFNLYLIEVNTNPCIEESSPLLAQLIPRMLDDAYILTLDLIFNISREKVSPFPVKGYQNNENMWQLLGSLKDQAIYQ
ncbi:unnamed protein product [Paramecium octaurelia]|uniref:ATP-grasp domain-containing protein n=1 Tax=Paramecium octaurelia TaxID=43137 RepID=A0A8S1XJP4_PAROT|nr:unnamed protein product [Paramecium octaurelia]